MRIKIILTSFILAINHLVTSQTAPQLMKARFQWNYGEVVEMSSVDNQLDEALEQFMVESIEEGLPAGNHLLRVQVQGKDGSWSNYHQRRVYIQAQLDKSQNLEITQARMRWDNDPVTFIVAQDGTLDEAIESFMIQDIETNSMSPGSHALSLSVKGKDGSWSNYHQRRIYIQAKLNKSENFQITQARLRWDNDPFTFIIAQDGALDEAIENFMIQDIETNSMSPGSHALSLSVKGKDGSWSNYHQRRIYIQAKLNKSENLQITQARLRWDNDPISFIVAQDGALDEAIESFMIQDIETNSMSPGSHILSLSVQGKDGSWSNYHQRRIYIQDKLDKSENYQITLAQFRWDNGPYTTVLAMDGALDEAIEKFMIQDVETDEMEAGIHRLSFRVKGKDGEWSNFHQRNIQFYDCSMTLNLGEDREICKGDIFDFDAGADFDSYQWYRNDSLVSEDQTLADSIAGEYVIVASLEGVCQKSDTVLISYTPNVQSSFTHETENATVHFTNTSENADTYEWSFGDGNTSEAHSPEYTYQQQGTYQIELLASNHCSSDTSSVEVSIIISRHDSEVIDKNIKVFPNPNTGTFRIDGLSSNTSSSWKLFSSNGLLLRNWNQLPPNGIFDCQGFTPGIYVLQGQTNEGLIHLTLVVK